MKFKNGVSKLSLYFKQNEDIPKNFIINNKFNPNSKCLEDNCSDE